MMKVAICAILIAVLVVVSMKLIFNKLKAACFIWHAYGGLCLKTTLLMVIFKRTLSAYIMYNTCSFFHVLCYKKSIYRERGQAR